MDDGYTLQEIKGKVKESVVADDDEENLRFDAKQEIYACGISRRQLKVGTSNGSDDANSDPR